MRLALAGHVAVPNDDEPDFLAEAEAAFAKAKPEKKPTGKKKQPTPIRAAKAKKTTAAKKRIAA